MERQIIFVIYDKCLIPIQTILQLYQSSGVISEYLITRRIKNGSFRVYVYIVYSIVYPDQNFIKRVRSPNGDMHLSVDITEKGSVCRGIVVTDTNMSRRTEYMQQALADAIVYASNIQDIKKYIPVRNVSVNSVLLAAMDKTNEINLKLLELRILKSDAIKTDV